MPRGVAECFPSPSASRSGLARAPAASKSKVKFTAAKSIPAPKMSELLYAAINYAKRGFPVVPVKTRDKRPLIAWEDYQTRSATEEEIKGWWAKWPDANVGIVTGAVSGLVVIDLDSVEAKDRLKEMLPGYDLMAVPRSRTGKGWQLFFKHPGTSIQNRAGIIPGLDVRGDGGYVVAPPSIHPNGKQYRWEVPISDELPKLPVELFKLISSSGSNGEAGLRKRFDTVRALAGVPEGERDKTCFKLACKLRAADVPQDMAGKLILEAATNCQPPFPEREALAKVENVYRRYVAGDGRPEKHEPIVEIQESEEKEDPLANDAVAFPEAAWRGLFGQWRDVVAPCTEAPLENLWGAFLVAVGLMLGRNVWKESPRPLYPNFYMLLLGQTGDSRKSTVLWLAGELLRHIGEDIEILTGIVSTEGIFERLAKKEETRALGYADEFRSLLSVAKRKGTQDILPKLNTLYYCPEREGIDRREKSTTVIRPFFSLITATAQEYIEDLLGNLEVAGGTLNRFLIISGEEQPPKPNVKSPSPETWESIAAPLLKIRDQWASTPQHTQWHPEAEELWSDFYTEWRTVRKAWDTRAANLTARIFEHVLKIALVYSALGGEEKISAKSLATAIAIGEWLQGNVLRLFGDVGLDQFTKAEKVILEILKSRRRMWRRDLQQAASKKKINGKLFGEVLRSLEANGHVKQGESESLSGQKRPFVEYIPGNREHLSSSGTREKVLGVPDTSPGGEL